MSHKLTSFDPDQIIRYQYDETKNASRVMIVNTQESNLGGILKESLDKLVELSQKEASEKPEKVEKLIVIPQIVEVEKYIPKIEFREVEKIIIQKEVEIIRVPEIQTIIKIEYREIEKPIIIEKYKEIHWGLKFCFILQTVSLLGLFIKLLIK